MMSSLGQGCSAASQKELKMYFGILHEVNIPWPKMELFKGLQPVIENTV